MWDDIILFTFYFGVECGRCNLLVLAPILTRWRFIFKLKRRAPHYILLDHIKLFILNVKKTDCCKFSFFYGHSSSQTFYRAVSFHPYFLLFSQIAAITLIIRKFTLAPKPRSRAIVKSYK